MKDDISNSSQQIQLHGDLGVSRLEEIKEQLLSQLLTMQQLHIAISEVTTLHLSTLQWIYAFGRAAQTEGKEVVVTTDLPAQYAQLVRASGLEKMYNRFGK